MTSIHLGSLSEADIGQLLTTCGLGLEVASFRCLLRSGTGLLAKPLRLLYQDYPAHPEASGFYDFRINLNKTRANLWSPWEVEFDWSGSTPFPSLPLAHTHPLFEWGLNWCVATASGAHTVIHSAVVERGGRALVLPGSPGSGKSTLCAALALGGWRLLSDELTIVSPQDGCVQSVARPISLKGHSIDVIRSHFPEAVISEPVTDTHKGSIAYVQPPASAVARQMETARIGFVVFPKYKAGTELAYEPLSRASALVELMSNTFNVGLLGASGFEALANAMSDAQCYAVEYGDLASITQWVDETCR